MTFEIQKFSKNAIKTERRNAVKKSPDKYFAVFVPKKKQVFVVVLFLGFKINLYLFLLKFTGFVHF